MLGILFALTFTLAAGSQHSYSGIEFAGRKTFIYHYEAQVLTGLPEKGFGRAGLRIKSKVEIRSANPKHFLLKTYDLKLEEFNGIWPRDSFTSSAKLSKLLEKQLSRPIKFEYSRGQVGDIYIPYGMSDIVVNIIKGILNILQITIKKTQNAYSLQESGIGGICYTSYTIEENKKTNQLLVIKSKDLNNCEDRVHLLAGDAFSYKCHNCNQRNKNSRAAATYNYKIKETRSGAVLTEADVIEVHQFTPFSEVGGTAILEARQRLVLVSVQELSYYPLENDYKTRGSLRYHFTSELFQTPVHLLKMKNAEAQAIEILHQLVEPSIGSSSKESPTKFLQLIQCLREASSENIEAIWKQFSLRPHYRRWILDAIPAIAKPLSLRFLKHKISIKDLTEFEAVQGVLMTLHLIKADHDAIAEAKSLLEVIKPQRDCLLRKVAFLSYGSLVLKKCIDHCSEDVLQPIKDLLAEAASESHERDMVLALKTLGNTEHPASIKSIQKFLPGFSSSASKLPVIIQSSALIALKSIAQKDPKKVQDICLQLIANLNTNRLIRIIAIGGLIESKPPAGIVMALANILQKETDIQVATYSYSLLKILSQSSAPDLQEVAAASDIAIALLKTKYERLGVSYSTGISYDVFRDSLMSGISVLFKTIKNPANGLPLAFLSKLKVHFMGVFTNLLEVGFQAEGIQELLMNRHIFSPESKPSNMNKIMDIIRKLSQWKPLPQDEPIASTSIMIFGQEIYYHHLDKSDLQNIVKFFYRPKEKFSTFGTIVTELQTGINMKWSKALLSSETRHIVPTCVGLPLETSLYYSSVTRAEVNAQAQIDALPAEEITFPKLIDSNININSKISISMDKDITFVMGINTHLIQAALEVQAQIHVSLPTNVAAKINIKQRNFKLEMEPPHKESEIISLRSKAYAVTRIAEDIDATKMIPVVPAGTEPNVLKQTFNPRDLSAGEFERTEKKYSGEVLHKEIPSSEEQQAVRPSVYSSCAAATNFGLQLCVQHKSSSAAFIRNSPFYHMIGSHSFKVIFKPVHMDASVEKIQIEFQAGPQAAGKMVRTVKFPKGGKEGQEMENTMDTMVLSKLKKILGDRAISQGNVNNNSKSSSRSVSIMETIKGARCKTEKNEKANHHELKKKHLHPHQKQKHLKCKCKEEEIKKHQHKHKSKCSKHKHGAKTGTHGHHHHSKKSNAPDARKNDQSNNENQHGRCKFLSSSSSSSESSSVSHRKQKDRKNVQQKDRKNVQQKDRKNAQQKDSKNVQQKDSKSKCSRNSENSSSKSSTSSESSSVSQRREKGNKNAQNQESNSKYTRCTESSSSESSNCIENSSSESSNSKESSSSKCRKEDSKNTESSNSEICESSESSSVSQSSISFWDELSSQSTDAGENPLSKNSSSDCGEWTNDANQHNASISCDCNKWPFTCRNSSAKPKKVEPLQKPQNPHQANTSIEYWETNGTVLYEIPVKSASALMQRFIGEAPEYTILVRAIMSDNTNRGYQSTTYLDSYKHHMQTIMVSLNENNPWKACLDAAISGSRKTWAMVRWGRHCQDYKMSAKLSSGQIAENSAVQMALQWGRLPTWMKDAARRVMKFMPGVAYMLGFSEIYRKNPSRKLIVRVAGTSTQQIDTIIKAPTLTIYKQAIPVPFYYAHGSYLQNWINENRWSILPEITSILTQAERVECEVRKERFTTFDKAHLDCSISSANTYTVLAQDCTNQLRFIITMKKMGRNNPTFQIDAKLGSFDIELYSDASKEFHVILDGRMLLLQNNTYVNEDACIRIHRNATMLTVKAPKHGVEQIAFNGEKAKVTIAPWLKGKTCGICGNADGQRHNDLLKPNQEKAKNCNSLVHSWMLPDNLCTGSMLNRQFVMLQNHLVDEEESACYSLEPVLKCLKGCNPTSTIPVKVAFHCLPKESAIDLEDWSIRPKELSVDLIQEVDAHSDCVCTTECAKA